MSDFYSKFVQLQNEVRVSKDQFNAFGKYSYRKCEDILAEAKPIANKLGLFIILSDEIVLIGNDIPIHVSDDFLFTPRFYVKVTATVSDGIASISNTSFARESQEKKGMDEAQITGASSSYARKYALSGLLGLDDEKDPDTLPPKNHQPVPQKPIVKPLLQSEDYAKKENTINNIKILMGKFTDGESLDTKTMAMKNLCSVNKFDDLKNKTSEELTAIQNKITSFIQEKNSRPKTIKDMSFKIE